MPEATYAGDITPKEAWDILKNEPDSVLVDVRTGAEWNFVGVPDLSDLGKEAVFVAWKEFPGMTPNPDFVSAIQAHVENKECKILFLCRSGQRSIATSQAMTAAGFNHCYNVLEGFEGDKCNEGHRGNVGGWKVANLPWQQK